MLREQELELIEAHDEIKELRDSVSWIWQKSTYTNWEAASIIMKRLFL
jgi:hypothetical protein